MDNQTPVEERSEDERAVLALWIFTACEAMFILALVVFFLFLRTKVDVWPPAGQPDMPMGSALLSTGILLLSGVTMFFSLKNIKRNNKLGLLKLVSLSFVLGILFLMVQALQWAQLVQHGLEVKANIYGGIYYCLIAVHAIHVVIALWGMYKVWSKAKTAQYSESSYAGVKMCCIFWLFVVLVWPPIFWLVYV